MIEGWIMNYLRTATIFADLAANWSEAKWKIQELGWECLMDKLEFWI